MTNVPSPTNVAPTLGIHPATLRRWAKAGKLPAGSVARTLGGYWRVIDPDAIRAAMLQEPSGQAVAANKAS